MSDFETAIESLAERKIVPTIERGDLVLIGGLSRLGKSTLASAIAAETLRGGLSATVITLDRWILPAQERVSPGVENRFDLQGALTILGPWLNQHLRLEIKMPDYDRQTRARRVDATELVLEPDTVLILEGVPALLLPIETNRRVLRIYVRGDETGRRERVISDLLARGIQSREVAESIYRERQIDEAPRIEASAAKADYVIRLG